MKKILSMVAIIMLACVLVACQNGVRTGKQVDITHHVSVTDGKDAQGKPTYKKVERTEEMFINPTRVAVFSLGVVDMLDTVGLDKAGVKSLGLPKSNLPKQLSKFNDDVYKNIGTLFEPLDDVLDLFDPELIILDGRSATLYEKFSERYPNADVLDATNTNYSYAQQEKVVENLGKLFPKVKEALTSEISGLKDAFDAIKSKVSTIKAQFVMSNGKPISLFGKGSRYNVLHDEFGFAEADPGSTVTSAHGEEASPEIFSEINPDVIFVMDRAVTTTTGESRLSDFLSNSFVKGTTAGQNDHVYVLDGGAWYLVTGGFKSTKQMIADINKYVSKLA